MTDPVAQERHGVGELLRGGATNDTLAMLTRCFERQWAGALERRRAAHYHADALSAFRASRPPRVVHLWWTDHTPLMSVKEDR